MNIRPYRQGDEAAQVSLYNEGASAFPKYKPATLDELRRRSHAADFDPATRLYAEVEGEVVGYLSFRANGRIGRPWCRQGHEAAADPLLAAALDELRRRGLRTAFAAYRPDWTSVHEFFLARGFRRVREIVNFLLDPGDMPTPAARTTRPISPLKPEDVGRVLELGAGLVRASTAAELEQHLFQNPGFSPDGLIAIRGRADGLPIAVGLLVDGRAYADPRQVDADMPCYRLGAFGSEGMTVKRIRGMFSFVAKGRDLTALGLDLLSRAALILDPSDDATMAAQVPSDAPELLRFYQQFFRRQGSFPVFERELD